MPKLSGIQLMSATRVRSRPSALARNKAIFVAEVKVPVLRTGDRPNDSSLETDNFVKLR